MNKLGIVFAGGGGKGGYEIGVWKYLRSIGLDKYIEVVSGTSVGALNSVLFAYGDLELAEDIWINKIENKILDPHSIDQYVKMGMKGFRGVIPGFLSIFQEIAGAGLFSRDGLRDIITENIDVLKISNSQKAIYGACCHIPSITQNQLINLIPAKLDGKAAEYFKLNRKTQSDIISILLASSAIPVAFEPILLNGKEYYDGGLKDNIPVKPLKYENCTHAIIVHLNHHGKSNPKWKAGIPNIIEIRPSEDLGNFIKGTLDFTPEGTRKRIALGEKDAKSFAEEFENLLKIFQNSELLNDELKEPESELAEKVNNVICLTCKNQFRINNFPGDLLKSHTSEYNCPNCGKNNLMKISIH